MTSCPDRLVSGCDCAELWWSAAHAERRWFAWNQFTSPDVAHSGCPGPNPSSLNAADDCSRPLYFSCLLQSACCVLLLTYIKEDLSLCGNLHILFSLVALVIEPAIQIKLESPVIIGSEAES